MKLASQRDGSPDGGLLAVSRDLSLAAGAGDIAPSLRAALENWDDAAPRLAARCADLDAGRAADAMPFTDLALESPLPRAFQFLDGSAYLYHMELVRRARGAELPESFLDDPLMYQGLSDRFLGPRDDIAMADQAWGIDFEAEIGVITDSVPMGVTPAAAADRIRLVVLLNDVSLRNLIPPELAKGFGFVHGKPASSFAPVAVAPQSLGAQWDGGKLHGPVHVDLNGERFGRPDAGRDMNFDFPRLIAHAAKTRALGAGTIIGSGTVSNRDPDAGSCCLAERRMIETIESSAPKTAFMGFGDRVRIEMFDGDGRSLFGAIDQQVVRQN